MYKRQPLDINDVSEVNFFEANQEFKCGCDFSKDEKPQGFQMPTYSGIERPYLTYGSVNCMVNGHSVTLHIYRSVRSMSMPQYKDHLFLPFMDPTNGNTTYGGGRYLNLTLSDITNDKLTIDFNKAYNPWCAYSDGYNCPIPPIENHLNVAIEAGEKIYTGTKKNGPKESE